MARLKKIWVPEADTKKVLSKLKNFGIQCYDEETLEELIKTLMPNANKHIRNRITQELTQPQVYTLVSPHIRRAVDKLLNELPDLLEMMDEAVYIGNLPNGLDLAGVRSTEISDPTSKEAINRLTKNAEAKKKINWSLTALQHIPERYRQGVWEHAVFKAPYRNPSFSDKTESTWKRYVAQYKFFLAREMGYGEELDVLQVLR